MSDFSDKIREYISGAADTATDVTSRIRYGVSPDVKQGMMLRRDLPGAPSYLQDPAAAERYSSAYLGAKKWGRIPAELFNALALSDIGQGAVGEHRKAVGALGAEAGSLEGQNLQRRRTADLQRLFRPR